MNERILIVGSLNMDFVVAVESLPAPGATVPGHSFQTIPGGKGANQACAAARLSAGAGEAIMIGRVGSDVFGAQLRESLANAGVGIASILETDGPTGVALIFVAKGGLNQIVVAPGANGCLSPADLEAAEPLFSGARLALFQLESPLETVAAGLRLARRHGAQTMLDPAPARALPPDLLALVDWLTPNETEALTLAGRPHGDLALADVPALARQLLAQGAGAVVVKLGSRGAYYVSARGEAHFPAPRVEAVDSTAAGDTFNGALAVALAEGRPLEQACVFANTAAALSVTRFGAQASIPSRAEVDQFLAAAAP